jgi:hypothetical protein
MRRGPVWIEGMELLDERGPIGFERPLSLPLSVTFCIVSEGSTT